MKLKFAAVLVVLTALLAACAQSAQTSATETPAPSPTSAQTEEPLSIGTPQLDMGTEEAATDESANPEDAALAAAQQALAQQLGLTPDDVTVVDYQAVDWPTTCLGLNLGSDICTLEETPGYSVTLEADGGQYQINTDAQGQSIALAASPDLELDDFVMRWQSPESPCQAAELGLSGTIYGLCGGAELGHDYVAPDRAEQLQEFADTYQPFEAQTPAGSIVFEGHGDTEASQAEQRMIASWAQLTSIETSVGQRSLQLGLVLFWHREGGLAGFCDNVLIYTSGTVRAYSCGNESGQLEELGVGRLSGDDLEQFYEWMDTYQQFTIDRTDDAEADAMTTQVIFAGQGAEETTEQEQQTIETFAQEQYQQVVAPDAQ